MIKPGYFSEIALADNLRSDYDIKNELILKNKLNVDYVFFGDSITQQWELNACFNRSNLIINRGIAGDKTRYALRRFEADVLQLCPRCCVILLGINDFYEIMPNFFQQSKGREYENIMKEVTDNILKIIISARESNILLAICSLIPNPNFEINETEQSRRRFEIELNKVLKMMASEYGYIYVDYFNALLKEETIFTVDGTHPNYLGYNIMSKVLKETLLKEGIEI